MQQTIAATFFSRAETLADRVAIRFKEGRSPYRELTWGQYSRMVTEMAYGLAAIGFEPGQSAAILSNTSHLWVASDLAIMSNGCVSVPIYPTSSQADIQYILENSEAQCVFVQSESLMNRVLSAKEQLPNLKKLILLSAPAGGKSLTELNLQEGLVIGLEELQELGRQLETENEELIRQRIDSTDNSAVATIIYTSGTTGIPKGVILTYENIFGVLNDLPGIIPLNVSDTYLSFLPLSHVFERVCGEFHWLFRGDVCAFAESIDQVGKNMVEIEPTMILVVPRVLDRIHAKVQVGIMGATGRARALMEWSIATGKELFACVSQGRSPGLFLKCRHYLAERLVLQKLRARIGRRLRLVVSGGAPANAEVIEFFNAIGIPTLEGYGLTETAAPVCVNLGQQIKLGTVGGPLPSVQIKLADDGEILVKGPGVFKGYLKSEEMTAEVFDAEGWFHTGDIGSIDQDGYLKITDRKKDLIINSAGKNIAPQRIESVLKTIQLISQAVVFGDKRKHLVAVLTLDEQAVTELAQEKGWDMSSFAELTADPELGKHLRAEINKVSDQLAECERIRNFAVLPRELSVESGELTATLKVRRGVVAREYSKLVDSLYRDEESLVASGC